MDLNVELRTAIEALGRNWEEFKAADAQNKKERDGALEAKIAKLTEEISKQHEALTAIETKQNRPALSGDPEEAKLEVKAHAQFSLEMSGRSAGRRTLTTDEYKSFREVFPIYLRHDKDVMDQIQVKALSLGGDPEGGYFLTPPEISNRITKRVFETTPMRDIATVQPIGAHEFKIPQDPNTALSGGWTGETTTRTNTGTANVAMKTITAFEQYAMPVCSQQLLEDSFVDIEAWYADKTADIIARTENTAFVNGTGASQPRGFMTYPSGTNWGQIQQIGSGTSGEFTYAGLLNLITSLKEPYQPNASFVTKRANIASVMLIQDGNGRYIFQPIVGGNFNNTALLGYNLRYGNDIPAVGAGTLAMAFGDFKRGYVIVDRIGISVLRDAYTAKPNILYYTRKRTGGDVDDFDAIKLLVLT
ncbi:MAG TPA: phage major capsid protein [Bryobacteraceae bacterium]|jgi:HK97 family phage major capsid protein|nr:phage major capsid protein [Bryobacteraceae bacterium]